MKIVGSAMVCVAANREEVIEVLKSDIYATSEVWDFSKVCVRSLERHSFNWCSRIMLCCK